MKMMLENAAFDENDSLFINSIDKIDNLSFLLFCYHACATTFN